jgi:hypothetical protein
LILATGNFWMSQHNLDISPWQAVWPRVVMILGFGMIFAPLKGFLQQRGDLAAAHRMALQSLEDLREQQASALTYFGAFLIFAVVAVVLAFLVLLMKRSVAGKGAHLAAE